MRDCWARCRRTEPDDRIRKNGDGDHHGHDHHQPRSHAVLSTEKAARLTAMTLTEPKCCPLPTGFCVRAGPRADDPRLAWRHALASDLRGSEPPWALSRRPAWWLERCKSGAEAG